MKFPILATAGLAATLFALSAPADANVRSTVKVINNSSYTVLSIYSSPSYRDNYGDTDLLGRNTVVRPGYEVRVDFDSDDAENECLQDIQVKGTNGVKWQRRLNVCRISTWTLND